MNQHTKLKQVTVLLVLALFIMLPVASALEISNVHTIDVTDTSATVVWETDEPADGFVSYSADESNFQTEGHGTLVTEHSVTLNNLNPETSYSYSVESNGQTDDDNGNFYSFSTLPLDTEAPQLTVELPTTIQGNTLSIEGSAEVGAFVNVILNNDPVAGITVDESGTFLFSTIQIIADTSNTITVQAVDPSGNTAEKQFTVISDNTKPTITIDNLPDLIEETTITLSGTISEESSIEILINNKSQAQTDGTTFEHTVQLTEGANIIEIKAIDAVGWESLRTLTTLSDTQPPQVKFELTKGSEYYEGRADTDITGETEPGATLYLFVYQPRADDYQADFQYAIASTTADEGGNFTFSDVSFPPPAFSSLEQLAPREVPSGLQSVLISPLSSLSSDQTKSYHVYIIAEDATGKSGYAQRTVNVNTCFSANQDFDIHPLIEFQAPFRLDPQLMEEGREQVQSVFNFSYRGAAVETINQVTKQPESGYRVSTVRVQKACTKQQTESDDYATGCKLLPPTLNAQPINDEKTSYYITSNLVRADEFVERDEDLWQDFQDRQLKMPLKILINYQEKDTNGAWGTTKTQVMCYDLGYFVDVPIESSELVPDFLANEGVDALNATINAIEEIKPYMRTVMLVTGVSCMGSFLTKMAARFFRFFMENLEPITTKVSQQEEDVESCPEDVSERQALLSEDTIEEWEELAGQNPEFANSIKDMTFPKKTLDKLDPEKDSFDARCPDSAGAWDFESSIDQLYRWTCDRFLCRPVPARWTEDKDWKEVQTVIAEQASCSATGSCSPLIKVENCPLKKNPALKKYFDANENVRTCYQDPTDGYTDQYYVVEGELNSEVKGIWKLKAVPERVGEVGEYSTVKKFAYEKEPGSSQLCVAPDVSCNALCARTTGHKATTDGYSMEGGSGACYKEVPDGNEVILKGKNNQGVDGVKTIAAGHTRDCFIGDDGSKYQCVCQRPNPEEEKAEGPKVRTAVKTDDNGNDEPWQYRQARIYSESNKQQGTYYPDWRYYQGRDLSGAFGLNYIPDYINPDKPSTAEVNPHTQTLSAFQTMCIPQINARLELLQSILIGLRNCIVQAKFTGFQDAGMCKTIFTQYVCGLIYKGISYLSSSCSPLNLKDADAYAGDDDVGVGEYFDAGFKAIDQAMDTSINEIQDDYGNANLEQFFATGAQGFSESICLAAFGYDFPMDTDFILDTAYSVPGRTDVFMFAEREMTTFNPIAGTPTFNYNLAGVILPGCKLRGYKTYLKCVGPEDLGNPNIDCTQQNCDCMNINNAQTPFAGERVKQVDGGSSFTGVPRNQMLDMPIPSPQKISSHFRYDHMVMELYLAQGEDPSLCFDSEYQTATGGVFYTPITHIMTPGEEGCTPDPNSGRLTCPQLASLVGAGGTYFEHPFLHCYNKETDEFVDCERPNNFLLNDQIVVKPYIFMDGSPACLKLTDNRNQIQMTIPLPQGHSGPYSPRVLLATVTETMLAGSGLANIVTLQDSETSIGCGGNAGSVFVDKRPSSSTEKPKQLQFKYAFKENGKYQVEIPNGVTVDKNNGYDTLGVILTLNGESELTLEQVNNAKFSIDGFVFNKLLQSTATSSAGVCKFQTIPPGEGAHGTGGKFNTIQLTAQLLQGDEAGLCTTASIPVAQSNLGKNTHTQPIRVQAEKVSEVVAKEDLHNDFITGNYNLVQSKAQAVVQLKENDLDHVIALYYWIASFIMQDSGVDDGEIKSLLDLFFDRNFLGETLAPYPPFVTSSGEFQKIKAYLCAVDQNLGGSHASECGGIYAVTNIAATTQQVTPGTPSIPTTVTQVAPGSYNVDVSKGSKTVHCVASGGTTAAQRALLDTIAWAEGASNRYDRVVDGSLIRDDLNKLKVESGKNYFTGFEQHPKILIHFNRKEPCPDGCSTAAGRYQFLGSTYEGLKNNHGQFSAGFIPSEQDRAALKKVELRGVSLADIETAASTGNFVPMWDKLAKEWASIPYSPTGTSYYGQGGHKLPDLQKVFNTCLQHHNK